VNLLRLAPGLRLPRHRATTAHLASAYPFMAEAGLPLRGPYLGTDLLTGAGGFAFDPFEAYRSGVITNPNIVIAGEPGVGKSTTAKILIYRAVGVFGRWVAIADPKGEYLPLAAALGLDTVKLHPGGTTLINPLDPGPGAVAEGPEEVARRQSEMVSALLGSVLGRDLEPLEDAALGWAVEHLARRGAGAPAVTLADVAAVLAEPPDEMAARARIPVAELARAVAPAVYSLGKLLDRSLRGMFDGATNVRLDWSGPGVLIDLSAVHHDPEALPLVMLATTAWLRAVMATPEGPARLQVLDEACLLASERTTRYLQACWKLGRAHGVANLAVVHRLSDLRSQADDGSATAKVGMGLLGDTQTRVIFRQASDQVKDAAELLGLSAAEAALIPRLAKGRALWKLGDRAAVVQHHVGRAEAAFCDTDARMVAR
jgi:DNA polymerase III delta prime subunit